VRREWGGRKLGNRVRLPDLGRSHLGLARNLQWALSAAWHMYVGLFVCVCGAGDGTQALARAKPHTEPHPWPLHMHFFPAQKQA
jgi:hypothetical protein